jgi:hypothetical protein
MKRGLLVALLALTAAGGCKHVAGPFEARKKPKPDAEGYSLDEQRIRARDKYALMEDDFRTGPKLEMDRPGPTGR